MKQKDEEKEKKKLGFTERAIKSFKREKEKGLGSNRRMGSKSEKRKGSEKASQGKHKRNASEVPLAEEKSEFSLTS